MIDVSVLVVGFDDWAVMWTGFCHFWQKYWPDCPWPLLFMANGRVAPCGETLHCGTDTNWTTMMRSALQQIRTPYLLLMLADYWLSYPVEGGAIVQFVGHMERYDTHHIRLQRSDADTQHAIGTFEPDPRLFVFGSDAPYCVSLQAGLWNRRTLATLLHRREDPWEFETRASRRAGPWLKALCIDRSTTPDQWNGNAYFCYHNMVSMGQWNGKPIDDRLEPDVRDFIERYG